MARVVCIHELGGPEVMRLEEAEIGEPGPGEIRIRVQAIGLNRAEARFRAGQYLEATTLPTGIGYEAAGTIEALGDGVDGFRTGEAVSVIPSFSMSQYSVYGEQAIVPAFAVAKTPGALSPVEAAAIWMQYLTAYGALIDIGKLGRGEAVIIPAASSSVGLAAIQIANSVGAIPIAATRTSAKKAEIARAGAAHVVATQEEDLVAEVMRATKDKGARMAFDPVAGPYVETLAKALAPEGILFVYGRLSPEPTPFPMAPAFGKGLSMRAYTLFEITKNPARLEAGKAFVTRGIESGALKPIIAKTFPLDQIVEAHRYLESNQQVGKIVVTV